VTSRRGLERASTGRKGRPPKGPFLLMSGEEETDAVMRKRLHREALRACEDLLIWCPRTVAATEQTANLVLGAVSIRRI
jgi:hypothetical protein